MHAVTLKINFIREPCDLNYELKKRRHKVYIAKINTSWATLPSLKLTIIPLMRIPLIRGYIDGCLYVFGHRIPPCYFKQNDVVGTDCDHLSDHGLQPACVQLRPSAGRSSMVF